MGVLKSTRERFGGQGALQAEGAALLAAGLQPWAGCCAPCLDRAIAAACPLLTDTALESKELLCNPEHWSPRTHLCRVRTQG